MKAGIPQHTRRYSLIIITLTALVYANTFQAPFIFDDSNNIIDNRSIRGEPTVFHALIPAPETGIPGRPLVNFTLAINYAISGLNPWSYHLFNLIVHISAALVLFGIVHRTFLFRNFQIGSHGKATTVAFASALIWSLHPLQTQAVTYTIQRCESLMGLCFLLIFYFAIRGWQSAKQNAWHLASVFAFLFGVGVKEVIIVAPVLLFYYDLLFVNRSPREALKRSWLLYVGLLAGMVLMVAIVVAGGTRSTMTHARVYSVYEYWRTQPLVTWQYVRLVFWPAPLSFDYDLPAANWADAWPACLLFTAFVMLTLWGIVKRHPLSFATTWFLLILSPTMLVNLPDLAFEHRMYLSLVAIVVPSVFFACRANDMFRIRLKKQRGKYGAGSHRWIWYLFVLIILSLSILTFSRNGDYRNISTIWQDAALKYPRNSRALSNFGEALIEKGNYDSALSTLNAAMRIEREKAKIYAKSADSPGEADGLYIKYLIARGIYATIENNLGIISMEKGDTETALSHFQAALTVAPNHVTTLTNMGLVYIYQGRILEAIKAFEKAIEISPDSVKPYINMAALMRQNGKPDAAIYFLKEALRLKPENAKAHYHMGMALIELNKVKAAVPFLEKALHLDPNFRLTRDALNSIQPVEKSARGTS